MEKLWLPLSLLVLGVILFCLSQYLSGQTDQEAVISHFTGVILFIGSIVCAATGAFSFFMRDHEAF
jgi:hypothetical protein